MANSGVLQKVHGDKLFYLDDVNANFPVKGGNVMALKGIKLSIRPGEIIFLTGPSGAGKTTLLRLFAGEVLPSSGVMIRPGPELFIGAIAQDLQLLADWTCYENLLMAFDPLIYRHRTEFQDNLEELGKVFGITDCFRWKVSQANGGLRQKIAIVRALLARPSILLADEPTSALDYENSTKLYEVLHLYNRRYGMTIVWATHHRELVKQFTGRTLHLDRGRLVYTGHACFI